MHIEKQETSLITTTEFTWIDQIGNLADFIGKIDHLCDQIEDRTVQTLLTIRFSGEACLCYWMENEKLSPTLISKWERLLRRMEKLRCPIIAVVESDCIGAAFEMLLVCDFRIAVPGVCLSLTASSGTVWPGMGIHRLVNQIGPSQARNVVLFGSSINTVKAVSLGLMDIVTDSPELAFSEFTRKISFPKIRDISVRRNLMLESVSATHEEALGVHLAACDRALRN